MPSEFTLIDSATYPSRALLHKKDNTRAKKDGGKCLTMVRRNDYLLSSTRAVTRS